MITVMWRTPQRFAAFKCVRKNKLLGQTPEVFAPAPAKSSVVLNLVRIVSLPAASIHSPVSNSSAILLQATLM